MVKEYMIDRKNRRGRQENARKEADWETAGWWKNTFREKGGIVCRWEMAGV